MLSLSGDVKIFMCTEAVDLRKGFEGLSFLVEALFPKKLFSGAYFAFLNKSSNKIKVLYWDVDGLAIWCKRLERGTYPKKLVAENMDRRLFLMLLEGVIPRKITPRFSIK